MALFYMANGERLGCLNLGNVIHGVEEPDNFFYYNCIRFFKFY